MVDYNTEFTLEDEALDLLENDPERFYAEAESSRGEFGFATYQDYQRDVIYGAI